MCPARLPFNILVAGLWLCILAACHMQTPPGEAGGALVVLAEVTAGDSVVVPIGRSLPGGNGASLSFERTSGAALTITGSNGAGTTPQPSSSRIYEQHATAVYTSAYRYEAGITYQLLVSHPALGRVEATTRVPGPFTLRQVSSQFGRGADGQQLFTFDFTVVDPPAEKNYYIFEALKQMVEVHRYFYYGGQRYSYDSAEGRRVYDSLGAGSVPLLRDTVPLPSYQRLGLYTYDRKTDNAAWGSIDSSFQRIFIRDSSFQQPNYHTFFSVQTRHFVAGRPEDRGRIVIRLRSCTPELYHFLMQYERFRREFGTRPVTQLPAVQGNIANGYGIFGGAFKREWVYYFDPLE